MAGKKPQYVACKALMHKGVIIQIGKPIALDSAHAAVLLRQKAIMKADIWASRQDALAKAKALLDHEEANEALKSAQEAVRLAESNLGPDSIEPETIASPMPGVVVGVVDVGDDIKAGGVVAVVRVNGVNEEIRTEIDLVVKEVHVKKGDEVEPNQVLLIAE